MPQNDSLHVNSVILQEVFVCDHPYLNLRSHLLKLLGLRKEAIALSLVCFGGRSRFFGFSTLLAYCH
ncbi:MAG: hypothetical protein HC790_13470 [Acaryochloridaceae cyanobacterium CSU_3_4]|nr:hypothetical protein [Acaryochloridaceae cyanobacterium CSU_3_4]